MFEKFQIPFPKTKIIKPSNEESCLLTAASDFNYPFLVKEHFGNHSKGIYHISDLSEFKAALNILKENKVTTVAIQELIDNDSDFRIIVIGDKVYQTYKRDKGKSKSWTTTSTSNGSIIDFSALNKDLEEKFIQFTNLLNLSNAAYDASIIDDEIIIYEVSSSYLTNPEPPEEFKNKPYIDFKKRHLDFDRLIHNKVQTEYRKDYSIISQSISSAKKYEDWVSLYKEIINWELDLDNLSSDRVSTTIGDKQEWDLESLTRYQWHIVAVFFNKTGNQIGVRVDGSNAFTPVNDYDNSLQTNQKLQIMRNRASQKLEGDFAEFFVVADVPGTGGTDISTLEKAEGYLAHKWGLTSSLPVSHPYKTSAP